MARPKPVRYGLYSWTPEYGLRYIHPANRRTFEWLEPMGKLFEKIDETEDWILIRYDEQQFKVSGELFTELNEKPKFSFGDLVEEVNPEPGQPPTAASSPTCTGTKAATGPAFRSWRKSAR